VRKEKLAEGSVGGGNEPRKVVTGTAEDSPHLRPNVRRSFGEKLQLIRFI
tara:strand:+ start:4607 stop:4756 length:150 start_codon:yes stop_codon:yes gene_type:complete